MSKRRLKSKSKTAPAPEPEIVAPKLTSPIVKRSIVIAGHKTSVSLEDPFWGALKRIQQQRSQTDDAPITLSKLVAEIDKTRTKNKQGNLSSALRLHVLAWAFAQADLLELPAEMAHG